MKKLVIALAIAGVFVAYSLGIRHELPRIRRPSSLSANPPPSSSSTNATPPSSSAAPTASQYKDGTYTGSVADAYYGNVQVAAVIGGGKITTVNFLQYPDTHSTSVIINQQAMPYLQQEAIKAQSANVQIISGATFTSQAFAQSLAAALAQAVSS